MTSGIYERPSLADRIANKTFINPLTDCHEWQGSLTRSGYGNIRIDRKTQRLHKVVWELANGPVPLGLELDHLCRIRHCHYVAHLETVTHQENISRKKNHVNQNTNKTHCVNDHEYTEDNTYYKPKGGRDCRTCRQARIIKFRLQKGVDLARHGRL